MEITIEEVIDGVISLFTVFCFIKFVHMICNMPQITEFLTRLV